MKYFHRNNHFVPKNYLKRWSTNGHQIWGYPLLVSNQNILMWKLYSISGIAYHTHLYTKLSVDGLETDEFERWLDKEFETPVEEAIYKATSDHNLSPMEWEKLIRFAAAQSVRTPAQLIQNLERWRKEMPSEYNSTKGCSEVKRNKPKRNILTK